jgi:hypothetical protein
MDVNVVMVTASGEFSSICRVDRSTA